MCVYKYVYINMYMYIYANVYICIMHIYMHMSALLTCESADRYRTQCWPNLQRKMHKMYIKKTLQK